MFYVAYKTLRVMFCVLKFYFVDFKGACADHVGFFSKLLRFWYHKNSYIFLIIILKFHALIPYRSEENIKNVPNLLIWWLPPYKIIIELQRQFIFSPAIGWFSSSSWIVGSEVKHQYAWN